MKSRSGIQIILKVEKKKFKYKVKRFNQLSTKTNKNANTAMGK